MLTLKKLNKTILIASAASRSSEWWMKIGCHLIEGAPVGHLAGLEFKLWSRMTRRINSVVQQESLSVKK